MTSRQPNPELFTSGHRLPEELLGLIVHELAPHSLLDEEQRVALASCLSISRSLRHYALSRLFKHVRISNDPGKGPRRMALLRQILASSTTLENAGPLIKELSCFLEHRPTVESLTHDVNGRIRDFIFHLAFIVNNAQYITRFAFEITPSFMLDVSWSELTSDLQDALQSIPRSPYLKSLEIRNLGFLPPTFLFGTHIVDLRLQQLPHDLTTDHSYQYRNPSTIFANLKRLVACNRLQANFDETWNIVKYSASTLEDLRVEQYNRHDLEFPSQFRLDQVPNLKRFAHFRLQDVSRRVYLPPHDISLGGICQFMDVLTPMNKLTSIDLEFTFYVQYEITEDFLHVYRDPQWAKLDKILSGPQYSALEFVAIMVHARFVGPRLDFNADTFSTTTVGLLKSCFPRISMNELLKVTFTADIHTSDTHLALASSNW
ncbi:hypothetical protein GALMADRAFT_1357971 [Galerina marginata CBS 339.88]|uniref:F-box domain-containing protein n=1 Tax=Galerina marginata (strain CBS 339.88) TaxID=685588 RepID=A0A067TF27_GALM3|nr:hypothetical protein GALMADRAFT_1357971 [Galerina marginata CBS 339.88]